MGSTPLSPIHFNERVYSMPKQKYNSKDIMDKFVSYFEGDKPFTPSQHRMNGIKLSQLRKNVKQYLEDNSIQTDLTINEIIMEIIEYSQMMGYQFRSIASLGFDVLGESIEYWQKRREIMAKKEKEKESNENEHQRVEKVIKESYNEFNNKNRTPKWMNTDKW